MPKSKIFVDSFVLDRISNSKVLSEKEKISYLKYVWYMLDWEKRELLKVI